MAIRTGPMMSRRAVVAAVGAVLIAAPRRTRAQPSTKVPRIAYLTRSAGRDNPTYKAFAEGVRELGYAIGETLIVDVWTPERDDAAQYPEIAVRAAATGPDVILASNPYAIAAAVTATRTIPVVGVDFESDPVARGWVATLARPGGNVTGFFLDIPEVSGKQLQLLKEVKPSLAVVAVLGDTRVNGPQFRATEVAARGVGLALQPVSVTDLDAMPKAIEEAVHKHAGALLVLSSPMVLVGGPRIAQVALRHRLPAIGLFVPVFAQAGGLLAYGPTFLDPFRRAATYVDRILRGAHPGDLPVQRPTKFELVVNLKTARALGLALPRPLLLRADQVIE